LRGGRDFYQVEVLFAGHLERFERWHDSNLLAFVADHANFAGADTIICADKPFIDTKPPLFSMPLGYESIPCPMQPLSTQRASIQPLESIVHTR
jgi:hypothetical protein